MILVKCCRVTLDNEEKLTKDVFQFLAESVIFTKKMFPNLYILLSLLCLFLILLFHLCPFLLPPLIFTFTSTHYLLFWAVFPQGSPQQIIFLHLTPSPAFSTVTPTICMSSITTSISNLLFLFSSPSQLHLQQPLPLNFSSDLLISNKVHRGDSQQRFHLRVLHLQFIHLLLPLLLPSSSSSLFLQSKPPPL